MLLFTMSFAEVNATDTKAEIEEILKDWHALDKGVTTPKGAIAITGLIAACGADQAAAEEGNYKPKDADDKTGQKPCKDALAEAQKAVDPLTIEAVQSENKAAETKVAREVVIFKNSGKLSKASPDEQSLLTQATEAREAACREQDDMKGVKACKAALEKENKALNDAKSKVQD